MLASGTGPEALVLLAAGSLAFGAGSAFVPVLNAEAYALAAAAAKPSLWWVMVLAVAVGQTAGKLAFFYAARYARALPFAGRFRRRERPATDPPPDPARWRVTVQRWSEALLRHLDRPVSGGAVMLTSSLVGIPPLAVVAVLAGRRALPAWVFTVTVGVGRVVRFAALAWPVVALTR